MWIERLEFIGFGNLIGQRIDFAPEKLSVVLQPNEYGKSTMSEAVLALLYGYPSNSAEDQNERLRRKPNSGAAYKACVDFELDQRRLRIIRSFSENSVRILDLERDLAKANSDITAEFSSLIEDGVLGEHLTGLSRDLFRSTCFVGQRQLEQSQLSGDRTLSSMLLNIADTSGKTSTNVFDAIGSLEKTLASFTFEGRAWVIDELIDGLKDKKTQLEIDLKKTEDERQNCDRDVEKLCEVDERLNTRSRAVAIEEYFSVCVESAETDARLNRAQERLARLTNLNGEVEILKPYQSFPVDLERTVNELWLRRQARSSDLARLETEVKNKQFETQQRQNQSNASVLSLSVFSVEDAQMLSGLARTMQQTVSELSEVKEQYNDEYVLAKSKGVAVDSLAEVRRSLMALQAKDLEDAHHYQSMIVATRERAAECDRSADKARTILHEISSNRAALLSTINNVFWPCLVCAMVMLIPMVYFNMRQTALTDQTFIVTLMLYGVFCLVAAAALVSGERVRNSFRTADERVAEAEEYKQSQASQEMLSKLGSVEEKVSALAHRAGLQSGGQLIEHIQSYSLWSAQLKELDFLEHLVTTKEAHLQNLFLEARRYFALAGVSGENIAPGEVGRLSDAVNRFQEESRGVDASSVLLDHRQSEIRFLSDELKDNDDMLARHLRSSGLKFDSVDEGYRRFSEALDMNRRWQSAMSEIERLEAEITMEMPPLDLTRVVERLQLKKTDLDLRKLEIAAAHPDIMALAPVGDSMLSALGKEMSDIKDSLDALRQEREQLTSRIRTAMKSYEDNYVRHIEQLESVAASLVHVEQTRDALLLARDTLIELAKETHSIWADRLTDISRDVLKNLHSEYESLEFDADLRLSVRRKGQRESINQWSIHNQLSSGTKEQLHWLARMCVVGFLSKNRTLPLILDEPFSETDDERFVRMMRFLINTVAARHQVIIFSCHQQRHEWLLEQLQPAEREKVELCRLVPMIADTTSMAKR